MTDHPAALAISTATFALLAQVADVPATGIPAVVTTMTSTGVLVWYLWFSTTKTIPNLIARFEAQLDEMREVFVSEQKALREVFEKQMESQRIYHRSQIDALTGKTDK